jgi:hypothetical protein
VFFEFRGLIGASVIIEAGVVYIIHLDFGIDGHEIRRLATDDAAILLFNVVSATHDNRLGSVQLCHRDLERTLGRSSNSVGIGLH